MKIVCLIGSSRHKRQFEEATLAESLAGNVVLSLACFSKADGLDLTKEQMETLRALHMEKIRMADEVLVINVERWLGDDTMAEFEFAGSLGKTIRLLEHKAMCA